MNDQFFTRRDNLTKRYERKFLITDLTVYELESLIKLHPAAFSEAFPPRQVNNIYFDTVDLRDYDDNEMGIGRRIKTRIRWYNNLFGKVANPKLEFKMKNCLVGDKNIYHLEGFSFHNIFSINDIKETFRLSRLPAFVKEYLNSMRPVLVNSYTRKYYLSADKRFRITIDFDLVYYPLLGSTSLNNVKVMDKETIIVELKYFLKDDYDAEKISSVFPFRLTKNSKYVTGIDSF